MTPIPMWECTKLDIESDCSSSCSTSDSETYNKNWEVEMLAEELDRREEKDPVCRKRLSFSGPISVDRIKRNKLTVTKSLDEWNENPDNTRQLSTVNRRSMSIGNLHSTLIRGLGNWIWGNAPQVATSTSSAASIPTISQTCPPAPPDI